MLMFFIMNTHHLLHRLHNLLYVVCLSHLDKSKSVIDVVFGCKEKQYCSTIVGDNPCSLILLKNATCLSWPIPTPLVWTE